MARRALAAAHFADRAALSVSGCAGRVGPLGGRGWRVPWLCRQVLAGYVVRCERQSSAANGLPALLSLFRPAEAQHAAAASGD